MGSTFSIQYRIIHKNGEIRWVQETASVFQGTEPDSVMFQGAIYDKTHQIKSDEQIRISEEHYRFLFEHMAEGAVYQDKNGIIIDANQSAEQILGLSRNQILGRVSKDPRWKAIRTDFSDFLGGDHPAMVTLRTGEKNTAIMGVFNPLDNQYRWIQVNSVPVYSSEQENPVQVFTTFEDITKEHIAKNALYAQEKQYRELVESISDTVFKLNKIGEFTYVSPVIEKNLGYKPYEVIGSNYLDFIHQDDREEVKKWFELTFQNKSYPIEFRGYNASHQIGYYYVQASPVFDGDSIGEISGIIIDITLEKENEKIKTERSKEIQGLLTLHNQYQEKENHIFSVALDNSLYMTESRLGFIAIINPVNKKIRYYVQSPEIMESFNSHSPPDLSEMVDSTIIADCLATKKAIIINDFYQLKEPIKAPFGDLTLNRFLIVPILENYQVVALLAVANKTQPYSESNMNSLATLGNTLWDIISRKWVDREINKALGQIAQNMEKMATLNDTIRNPLSVIAVISDLVDPVFRKDLMEAVKNIDSMVTLLDQGWIQSEKVRNFLIKHYRFTERELDSNAHTEK